MSISFSSWPQFLVWLNNLGMFHMELDLSRMRKAMRLAKLAHPPFTIIQVVGTNGKGSTSTFLESLARSHGLKTGLFTSPHFISPLERILVNGSQLQQKLWLEEANFIAEKTLELKPTYFEFLTLLALRLFAIAGAQIAIFEAGLGGRHDATSAIRSEICCFCPIALDHEAILGEGLEAIAKDKADALQQQHIAFSAPQFPIAAKILAETASKRGIPFEFVKALPDNNIMIQGAVLTGNHQRTNAALALAAWLWLAKKRQIEQDEATEAKALAKAFIPGRMQLIPATSGHPAFLLDGAHNPHAIAALIRQDLEISCLIFSALADKDWQNGIRMLYRRFPAAQTLVPQISVSRAASAPELAAYCNKLRPDSAMAFEAPYALLKCLGRAAMLAKPEKPVLVCGSLFLLSEFYALFPSYLENTGEK